MRTCRLLLVDHYKLLQRSVGTFLGRTPTSFHRRLTEILSRRRNEFKQYDVQALASAVLAVAKDRRDSSLAELAMNAIVHEAKLPLTDELQAIGIRAARDSSELLRLKHVVAMLVTRLDSSHRRREQADNLVPADGEGTTDQSATAIADSDKNVENSIVMQESDHIAVQRGRLHLASPNISFARFYTKQLIVKDEGALEELVHALRRRPSTFVRLAQGRFSKLTELLLADREAQDATIQRVKWLPPATSAFEMSSDSPTAASSLYHTPTLVSKHLQRTRQLVSTLMSHHAVEIQSSSSMLPALMLDPQPGDRVLDLCASPGSKTLHVLDLIRERQNASRSSSSSPATILVANDSQRSSELVRRLQRTGSSPVPLHVAVVATSFDGTKFPVPAADQLFMKVLVDAPCSGDGRLGRDVDEWRRWHPRNCLKHFRRQLALLERAIAVTAPGGRIVYSTCTMNPIENEAVVQAVMLLREGVVELEAPAAFAAAHLLPGVSSWSIPSQSGGFYESFREAEEDGDRAVMAAMFPAHGKEELRAHIARCSRRVLPSEHRGEEAFFVVSFRKAKMEQVLLTNSHAREEESSSQADGTAPDRRRIRGVVYRDASAFWLKSLEPVISPNELKEKLQSSNLRLVSPGRSGSHRVPGKTVMAVPVAALDVFNFYNSLQAGGVGGGSSPSAFLFGICVASDQGLLTSEGIEQVMAWCTGGSACPNVIDVPMDVFRCLLAQSQVDLCGIAALEAHTHRAELLHPKDTNGALIEHELPAWLNEARLAPGKLLMMRSTALVANVRQEFILPVSRVSSAARSLNSRENETPKRDNAECLVQCSVIDPSAKSKIIFAVSMLDTSVRSMQLRTARPDLAAQQQYQGKRRMEPHTFSSPMEIRGIQKGRDRSAGLLERKPVESISSERKPAAEARLDMSVVQL